MRRVVQGLLNKACPENVATILEKIAALGVRETGHLEILVELIFKKALAEPHYCETYADLVFGLQVTLPAFAREGEAGPSLTLRTALLGVCQREFEGLLADLEAKDAEVHDLEELEHLRKQRRERLRANVRLIGHLFLRKLLATKVVGRLALELTNCNAEDQPPEEHAVESACELLLSVGYTLELHPAGAEVLECVCARMQRLKDRKAEPEGKKGLYCKRVQFAIQDLLETRAAGWSKRSFKSAAKTKQEIREQQARDEWLAKTPHGAPSPGVEQVVVGQRPAYLSGGILAGG
uniref:MIF4G domain-containing protein n=1 Tax=Zooxanthella nutricula TaxID=1333877 RepID=A0A7S2L2P2_9DINO